MKDIGDLVSWFQNAIYAKDLSKSMTNIPIANVLVILSAVVLLWYHLKRNLFSKEESVTQEGASDNVTVEIFSPFDEGQVKRIDRVSGVANDPSSVQVFVLANDNLWYPQHSAAEHKGNRWTAQCYFGSEDLQQGRRFSVVAIAGADKVSQAVRSLPSGGTQSEKIEVRRID